MAPPLDLSVILVVVFMMLSVNYVILVVFLIGCAMDLNVGINMILNVHIVMITNVPICIYMTPTVLIYMTTNIQ